MMESDSKGRFIALEGGEGAGKSTQARLLAEALKELGLSVDVTREPGGTPGAEAIRSLLLDPPDEEGWSAQAEALLFAAARSGHVTQRIIPALNEGKWVVCDRFVDSSRAYQGGAGGLGDEAISALHTFGSGALRPDITLVITVDPAQTAERLLERDGGANDAIGGRSAEYHAMVARSFLELAKNDPDGFAVIDGNGSAEEVHSRIMQVIEERLLGSRND